MTRTAARPLTLLAASGLTLGVAVFTLVVAGLSLTSGHGGFSVGIAVALLLWAVLVAGVGLAFGRARSWARGPLVAANLVHVFSYGEFALTEPVAIVGSLAALGAVVCALLPATRAALTAGRDSARRPGA